MTGPSWCLRLSLNNSAIRYHRGRGVGRGAWAVCCLLVDKGFLIKKCKHSRGPEWHMKQKRKKSYLLGIPKGHLGLV